jgi:hypothetical protein
MATMTATVLAIGRSPGSGWRRARRVTSLNSGRKIGVTTSVTYIRRRAEGVDVSARVSTLLNLEPAGGRYVFLLVEWNDYADRVRDELNRQADAFGLDLGPAGSFVEAYPQRMYEVAKQVVAKAWPAEIIERFESDQEPIILIFDRPWETFDPRQDPYAIIWVSKFSNDPAAVLPLLKSLALRTRRGDDVIAYLHDVAERQRRAVLRSGAEQGVSVLARIASYVELKPNVFGVAIDLKAILRDIAERRRG